jgi:hypothetical protein
MDEFSTKPTWISKNIRIIGLSLILFGIIFRIFMLIFYYYVNSNPNIPWGGWGDVEANYYDVDTIFTGEWTWSTGDLPYPPLSIYFLLFLRIISFGNFELYVFYAFILEFIVALLFYPVLKQFEIPKKTLVFGLFLINPFYLLSYVFSASNCGYHITDSFFMLFLTVSLYFYHEEDRSKFYLFLALSMCAKWYTLPAAPYLLIKYFMEKDWDNINKIIAFIGIPLFVFLISPIFYLPNYLDLYIRWLSIPSGENGNYIYFSLKFLPFIGLFFLYLTFRLKNANNLEISFFSIILMNMIMLWSNLFVRYLTPLILYGHLKTKTQIFSVNIDFKFKIIKFNAGNHMLTFILSIIGCIIAIAIIIFKFNNPLTYLF